MNSILILAHAPLASALKSAALHIFPNASMRVEALDVWPSQTPESALSEAQRIVTRVLNKDMTGILVISDVLGATPCNVAKQLTSRAQDLEAQGVEMACIAGASLPMMLRAMTYWDEPLLVMAEKALVGGRQGAVAVS